MTNLAALSILDLPGEKGGVILGPKLFPCIGDKAAVFWIAAQGFVVVELHISLDGDRLADDCAENIRRAAKFNVCIRSVDRTYKQGMAVIFDRGAVLQANDREVFCETRGIEDTAAAEIDVTTGVPFHAATGPDEDV